MVFIQIGYLHNTEELYNYIHTSFWPLPTSVISQSSLVSLLTNRYSNDETICSALFLLTRLCTLCTQTQMINIFYLILAIQIIPESPVFIGLELLELKILMILNRKWHVSVMSSGGQRRTDLKVKKVNTWNTYWSGISSNYPTLLPENIQKNNFLSLTNVPASFSSPSYLGFYGMKS